MSNNAMRHQYHPIDDEDKISIARIKDLGIAFHDLCASIGESRELSLAKTHMEEAVMWAAKHCTRWVPLPSIPVHYLGDTVPLHSDRLTLGRLRKLGRRLRDEQKGLEPYILVLFHADFEPDVRDLPGFTPTVRYHHTVQPIYKAEIGRCERFVFAPTVQLRARTFAVLGDKDRDWSNPTVILDYATPSELI